MIGLDMLLVAAIAAGIDKAQGQTIDGNQLPIGALSQI